MESVLYSVVGFLLATGILVTLHEWGHYSVARWCGVKVLRFSIGFGPTIWSSRRGVDQTEWKIGMLPLGGYVQFLTERDTETPILPEEKHRAYEQKKPWQRIAIVAAGPLMNLAVAVLFYIVVMSAGVEQERARFAMPAKGTPLAQAGLNEANELKSWNGQAVHSIQDLQWQWFKHSGESSSSVQEFAFKTKQGALKAVHVPISLGGGKKQMTSQEDFGGWLEQLGFRPDIPAMPPVIGILVLGEPASQVGLKEGDRLTEIEGMKIKEWDDVLAALKSRADQKTDIVYIRKGAVHRVTLVPRSHAGRDGKPIGRIGIAPSPLQLDRAEYRVLVRYPFSEAVVRAFDKTAELSSMTVKAFYRMLTGSLSWKSVSGPVTMADIAGKSLQAGWVVYLNYLALISVSLGVMNLLPIPVLDGGHIIYETLAWLRGNRPLSAQAMEWSQKVGVMLLFGLMLLAFYNDFERFFGH